MLHEDTQYKKRKNSNNTGLRGVQHKLLVEASPLFQPDFSSRSNLVPQINNMCIFNIIFISTKY